jgi:hypothetical protein
MSTMTQVLDPEMIRKHGYDETHDHYVVVHPLDDLPEAKVDTDALGPMPMTLSVKWSLVSLRAYLVLMIALVFYRVLALAGLFGGAR